MRKWREFSSMVVDKFSCLLCEVQIHGVSTRRKEDGDGATFVPLH